MAANWILMWNFCLLILIAIPIESTSLWSLSSNEWLDWSNYSASINATDLSTPANIIITDNFFGVDNSSATSNYSDYDYIYQYVNYNDQNATNISDVVVHVNDDNKKHSFMNYVFVDRLVSPVDAGQIDNYNVNYDDDDADVNKSEICLCFN